MVWSLSFNPSSWVHGCGVKMTKLVNGDNLEKNHKDDEERRRACKVKIFLEDNFFPHSNISKIVEAVASSEISKAQLCLNFNYLTAREKFFVEI